MKWIIYGNGNSLNSGANFEGSRSRCVCSETVAVANSHNEEPAYCVGYCGNNGSVTRSAIWMWQRKLKKQTGERIMRLVQMRAGNVLLKGNLFWL